MFIISTSSAFNLGNSFSAVMVFSTAAEADGVSARQYAASAPGAWQYAISALAATRVATIVLAGAGGGAVLAAAAAAPGDVEEAVLASHLGVSLRLSIRSTRFLT